MMRRFQRSLRKHTGITARRVAVRSQPAWYSRLLWVAVLLLAGYGLGYWQFGTSSAAVSFDQLKNENLALRQSIVHLEQQSQVDRAAQRDLAKRMAAMQAEGMRLKEDVAFYESILQESNAKGEPRIHSIKLLRGGRSGEYRFQILLTQAGRHDKPVQGTLRLLLQANQGGRMTSLPIAAGLPQGGRVNFKYYQRVDGTFLVPEALSAQSLRVELALAGTKQQALAKGVNFPD